jgi:hypothetical protein
VSDDRSATEVVHEVRVNDQLGRAGSQGLWRWEQTGLSSGYCLCGWTAGYGQLMPTDLVVTRAAQHLRERHGNHEALTNAKRSSHEPRFGRFTERLVAA